MENEKIISKFLNKYPQYNLSDYFIECRGFNRYGGDWEIFVWRKSGDIDKYEYVGRWWCKQTSVINNDVYFEKEEKVQVLRMVANIDGPLFLGVAHYEGDDVGVKKAVTEEYKKDKIEQIKQLICDKIMSGEISIDIYAEDSDSWECPKSRVKIYNR